MDKEYTYKGHTYWVRVEAVSLPNGGHAFMAWVNNEKPGTLLYGELNLMKKYFFMTGVLFTLIVIFKIQLKLP